MASGLVIGACKRVEFFFVWSRPLYVCNSKHIRSMGIAGKAHISLPILGNH